MRPGPTLSPVRRVGAHVLAAIEEGKVSARSNADAILGQGEKRPLAILIAGPGGIAAYRPAGDRIAPGDIDAILPGALERFLTEAGFMADWHHRNSKEEETDR